MQTVIKLFMLFLWENKQRQTLPDMGPLKKYILGEIYTMTRLNRFFNGCFLNRGINLGKDRI
jgi:hypothetical protein